MINKTEKEIMKSWQSSEVMTVSIICVAFNHEPYIGEALDSFLMQETSFSFEVLINDDASTDRTSKIIKEYEKKFPNIIKPNYQSENQFSQGIGPMVNLIPKITGKYVAYSDGDDYWIDKDKLTIQVEEMEKHPNVDMSFHPSYKFLDGQRKEVISKHSCENKIFTPQEVILGGGGFSPTSSHMVTSRLIFSLPDWFHTTMPGDYIRQIMGAMKGGSLYINRCMSIHRVGHAGSWTFNRPTDSTEKWVNELVVFNDIFNLINALTEKKYQKEFDLVIHKRIFHFISRSIDLSKREEVYKLYKDTFSIKEKALWFFIFKNSNLHKFLLVVKYTFSNRY